MGNCQLSVIIPCHDFGRYLSGAIASVLNQESSVKSMEVIVVDDHSCDSETVDVLESWKNVDSRVYVLENPGMPGSATARNLGIESARGEWLAFLDADDIWLPGSIQTRWDVIEREEDAQWVCADHLIWLEDGSVEQEGFFMKGDLSRQIFSQAYDTGTVLRLRKPVRESLTTMLAWTGTVMVKRELMQRLGGFETSLRRAMDLNMWVRLANETDLFFIPRVVALYRQHNASVSHEDVAPHLWDIAAYLLLLKDPNFTRYRSAIHRKLAFFFEQHTYYHRTRGERWPALLAGLQSIKYHPGGLSAWKSMLAAMLGRT